MLVTFACNPVAGTRSFARSLGEVKYPYTTGFNTSRVVRFFLTSTRAGVVSGFEIVRFDLVP